MSKRILILDDDSDFNSLLTDIFDQADFEVVSRTSPEEAIKVFSEESFDVVVSDQQMPEMSGSEFMAKIKKIRPYVPIIMVSGYLDNDTIRDLIRDGVGGVFLKPLNIMALLERSEELIAESRKHRERDQAETGSRSEQSAARVDFPFRSFPCRSDVSLKFARKLYDYRNFKASLCLVGEPGSPFRAICEDVVSMEGGVSQRAVYLGAGTVNEEHVRATLRSLSQEGVRLVTFVVVELTNLAAHQLDLIASMAQRDNDFSSSAVDTRVILCITEDIDSLFDDGKIPEKLYLAMGASEMLVPPLRKCPADIPVIAQQMLVDLVKEKGLPSVPRLLPDAQVWLSARNWQGNCTELRDVMRRVLSRVVRNSISENALREAVEDAGALDIRDELIDTLSLARREFVAAYAALLDNDTQKTADALGSTQLIIGPYLR